jgi:uncharacterized Tic20 family protein
MENPTSDEKVLAALAHASVILAFFLGPIGATIVWVSQRNKSKYIRFHALQAMGYQVLSFWAWFISIFVVAFGVIGASLVITTFTNESSILPPEALFFLQPVIMLMIFGMWGVMFLIGFIGAVFCMVGKDFRYPILGSWLQRKLFNENNTEEETETWEDHWVGGVCHATAILQMWGMITPFVVWFSQKSRSTRLRFQALQALLYQLAATVAYIVSYAGFFVVYLFFIAAIVLGGISTNPTQEVSPAFGILFILMMAVFMLVWLAWMILYPVYFILAGIATIRSMRGHDFKYPILGKILLKRMSRPTDKEIVHG